MRERKNSEHFGRILRDKKLRSTPIRRRILEALALSEQPQSAEELYTQLQKKAPRSERLDLVTLYRNLSAFTETGLAISIDLGMGKIFYEFAGDGADHNHHHHHIVCFKCRKIEHLHVCGLEAHFKMLETMGYSKLEHKLEFSGLCKACS